MNRPLAIIPEDAKRAQAVVVMRVGEHAFGLPVMAVRDVMRLPVLTPIPLAPPVIAGLAYHQGQLVTVIDMRARLGLEPATADEASTPMLVMVEHQEERFGLMVDTLMEVEWLSPERAEPVPATMNPRWRDIAANLYTQGERLLVILNLVRTLEHAVTQ